MFTFYLGTHEPSWLGRTDVPLFVSARRLARQKRLPRAICRWALDSGGFSELSLYGAWRTTPGDYVTQVRRYQDEIGGLEWAAIQDWMCEPVMLARTGLDIPTHQALTIQNYEDLLAKAPEIPWVPVLQGWDTDDYLRHADAYDRRGHDLPALPRLGVGTVCRRQKAAEVDEVLRCLAGVGAQVHAFGFKKPGLLRSGHLLRSSDSLAWSYNARKNPGILPHAHKHCGNCLEFALRWRTRLVADLSICE